MQLFLALGLGLAFPLAFAPYGWWWLVPLLLGAVFLTWHGTPRQAALRGYVFGLGFFGHGVGWVQVSIHQFGLPMYSFSVTMTALFVAFMALYPGLVAWLSRRLPAGGEGLRLLLLTPALWTLGEWVRGWLFSGFPWLILGDSQTDGPLRGFLPVIGSQGTSLVLALVAGGLALVFIGRHRQRLLAVTFATMTFGLGWLLAQQAWTQADGAPRSVALIQGAVPQAEKWSPENRADTLARYASLTEPLWGTQVIVWPETALPAFPQEIPEFIDELTARARGAGTTLLLGLPTSGESGRYYNSLVMLGAERGTYSKHHLVPFGEFLPFEPQLRPLLDFLSIPMSSFSAGAEEQPVLEARGLRFGASICYEDAYASEVGKALPAANILVNVSNDAWFGNSAAPHQHLQIARVRAIEFGRPLLRATNTGISALIDHHGGLRAVSPQFQPYAVRGEVQPQTGLTPFARLGPWPAVALCVLMVPLAGMRGRRR